ncbi:MAG: hypothetical protein RBT62_07635 [Spirochaetia bacterium]|jgi:hypothetical protein|nr:hypothetical protein [Spirochaetia bacterium]
MIPRTSHRGPRPGAIAASLALFLFTTILAHATEDKLLAARGSSAYIEAAVPTPYAFNKARLSSISGLSGQIRIHGMNRDGQSLLLYRADIGYADSFTLTYYAWPELSSLRFDGFDGESRPISASIRMPLSWPHAKSLTSIDTLSSLAFPFRHQRLASSVAAATGRDSPEGLSDLATTELFLTQRKWPLLLGLALWSICIMALSTRQGGSVLLCLAMAIIASIAISLVPQEGELYSLSIPRASGTELSLTAIRLHHVGYEEVSWATNGHGSDLSFIALRSPLLATVPVSAFDSYDAIRFKHVPRVVRVNDEDRLAEAPFLMAWGQRE